VCAVVVFDQLTMSPIAEGSIRTVFAVAQLVVSALAYVEIDGSASGQHSIAGSVAAGVCQTQSAGTPAVDLALVEVSVVGEPTYIEEWIPVMRGVLGGRYFPSR
jgi:hypothetical protein